MASLIYCGIGAGRVCAIRLLAGSSFRLNSISPIAKYSKALSGAPLSSQSSSLVRLSSTNTSSDHGHNHVRIWTAERILAAGLLGLIPAAFFIPVSALDYALALALTTHVHWGVEAIVVDYIRPSVVGPTISKVAVSALYVISMLTLGGLFYFNYNDVGLVQAIKLLWKL